MILFIIQISSFVAFWLASVNVVRAENDWRTPCHDGWCQWDTSEETGVAHSTLIMNGHESVLSDITEAGGFRLEGCDPDWTDGEHTILLHCLDDRKCHHLFKGDAVDTMVRLPPGCGKGPFARVTKCHLARDRPHFDHDRIETGQRWHVTMSYDFHTMDVGKKGKVSMFITTSNIHGPAQEFTRDWAEGTLRKRGLDYDMHVRRWFDKLKDKVTGGLDQVKDKVVDTAKDAKDAVKDKADKGVDAVKDVAKDVKDGTKDVIDKAANSTRFRHVKEQNLEPSHVKKTFNVMDKSSTCDGKERRIKLDVDAEMNAVVGFGFTIVGTVVPPNIEEFSMAATLNGNITADYHVDLGLQGTFDTGMINFIGLGIPGLSIPGIITVGPYLNLKGEITAKTDIFAKFSVKNHYTLPNIKLVLPPEKGASSGDGTKALEVKDPLKLESNPGVGKGNATIDAHIIPRLDFGLIMLSGVVKFTAFIEMDAGAFFTIQLDPPEFAFPPSNSTPPGLPPAPPAPTPTKKDEPPKPTPAPESSTELDPFMTDSEEDMNLRRREEVPPPAPAPAAAPPAPSPSPSSAPAAPAPPAPTEAPKSDAPKKDPPKTDPPKTDSPKTDPPKVEPPKTEPPKLEKPAGAAEREISGIVNLDGAIFVRAGLEGTVLPFFRNVKAITLADNQMNFVKKRFGPPPFKEPPFTPMKPKAAAKSLLPKLGLECFLRPVTDKLKDAQESVEGKLKKIF